MLTDCTNALQWGQWGFLAIVLGVTWVSRETIYVIDRLRTAKAHAQEFRDFVSHAEKQLSEVKAAYDLELAKLQNAENVVWVEFKGPEKGKRQQH